MRTPWRFISFAVSFNFPARGCPLCDTWTLDVRKVQGTVFNHRLKAMITVSIRVKRRVRITANKNDTKNQRAPHRWGYLATIRLAALLFVWKLPPVVGTQPTRTLHVAVQEVREWSCEKLGLVVRCRRIAHSVKWCANHHKKTKSPHQRRDAVPRWAVYWSCRLYSREILVWHRW